MKRAQVVLLVLGLALISTASGAFAEHAADTGTLTRISSDPFGDETPGAHATEVEPHAVAHGRTIVATFQVGRNFGGGAAAIGFASSEDAGETWERGLLPGLTRWTPDPGPHSFAGDPVVAYDAAHGRWLIATLSRFGTAVSSSSDGATWSRPVSTNAVGGLLDKDWLTCDNWVGSPFRGHCYLAFSRFAGFDGSDAHLAVQTSADGGATWSPQAEIPIEYDVTTDTLSAEPIVRPNGELVIVFFERNAVRAIRSNDGGASFAPRETVSSYSHRLYSFAPDRFRGTPVPTVAVDAAGTVFAAWHDCRFRASCAGNDVVLASSAAPGTWTTPVRVPLGPQDATDYVLPALGVDEQTRGDGARIAVAYYSLSSYDCSGEACRVQAGLAASVTGGRTWRVEQVGQPMGLSWLAPTSIGRMLGDYVAAVFVPGRVVGIFALARPPATGRLDEATFAAALPLAAKPTSLRFASRPVVPVAGRTFAIADVRVQAGEYGWLAPQTLTCRARVGKTTLRTSQKCRWRIPARARGHQIDVTVAAGYDGAVLRVQRRYSVR
jgi:hypothetical protein